MRHVHDLPYVAVVVDGGRGARYVFEGITNNNSHNITDIIWGNKQINCNQNIATILSN